MSTKQPFEKVVQEHGCTVLRVCRALLASHDADDAWSETFLSAMRAYPDLPATANVEAWLVTIAHRKAIDVLRSRKRQPVPVEEVTEAPTAARHPRRGRRAVAGGPGAAWQTAPGGGLPLRGRPALRRDRADHRRHHRRGAQGRRRWHQKPAGELPGRRPIMNNPRRTFRDSHRRRHGRPPAPQARAGGRGRRPPRRRLPDGRFPGRHAAAGGHAARAGPRRLRRRGPRPRARHPGQQAEPPRAARAEAP